MTGKSRISTKISIVSVLAVAACLAAGYSQNPVLMTIAGALFVALTLFLALGVSKPIRQLTGDVEQIACGKYDTDIHRVSGSEINTLAASLRKLTAHIKDEAAVSKSIQLSIETPFFMADRNTLLTYINKPACELIGVTADEVVGKAKVVDLIRLDDAIRSALSGTSLPAYEVDITNRFRESIPVMASSGPIRKANGEIVGAFLTFFDLRENIARQRKYLEDEIKPIEEAVTALASGDLTASVEIGKESQLYELGMEVDKMIHSLRNMLQQVSQTSSAVASASSEISSSTEELSAGAQEQSSHTNEVAASVEEMTRTVIENSKNATLTADIAKNNGVVAKQGGQIVEDTVKKIRDIADVVQKSAATVERLGSATQEIGEIVRVIDDIADQTNLLALNAAIEAARAGEEGRGFAVVADEVKKLAERTTEATKQIAAMIKNVQSEAHVAVESMKEGNAEVGEGIKLADNAGESLRNIVNNTEKVVDMMMQIAAASEEQSATSEQISLNVESISTVASESAKGIGQIARSTDDLTRLTDSLQSLVASFRFDKKDWKAAGQDVEEYHNDEAGQAKYMPSQTMIMNR